VADSVLGCDGSSNITCKLVRAPRLKSDGRHRLAFR